MTRVDGRGGASVLPYLVVFDGDHVAKVVLDRLHGVNASQDVGGLLRYHHLGRVRVAAHRVRHDRRVDDT